MKKRTLRLACLMISIGTLIQFSNAQCTLNGPFPVNDFDVFNLTMEIEGLANADLSDPSQGICGVALEFEHERVGNLFIELTSPSGQDITLVGPNGPFGLTQFTQWDISFLPCASAVAPDLNFGPFYTNQNSWGNFGNYTGSYYPFDGCLEDFDNGSANGTWTFTIRDAYQFDAGVIESISLFFCDPSGLSCQECAVPEIELLQDTLEVCQSDLPSDSINWNIGANYDPSKHAFSFLLIHNDTLLDISSSPVLPDGILPNEYDYCGLAYEQADSSDISGFLLEGKLYSELIDSLEAGEFCFRNSESCTQLFVAQLNDTIQLDTALCAGDTIQWNSNVIDQTGTYSFIDTANSICEQVYVLTVVPLQLEAKVAPSDPLTCNNPFLLLDGSMSDYTVSTSIEWYRGQELIAKDTLMVTTTDTGTYRLILEDMSCSDTLEFEIVGDFTQPYVDFGPVDSLKCGADSVLLEADTVSVDSAYFLNTEGDSLFTSALTVTQADTFIFVAVNNNGCSTIDTLIVAGDNRQLNLNIDTLVNLCGTDTIDLRTLSGDSIHTYFWEGPNGFLGEAKDTFAFVDGVYTITAIHAGSNCSVQDSFEYTLQPALDTPMITSDSLSCLMNQVQIRLDSINNNYQYQWYSPDNDTFHTAEPYLTEAGMYQLEITAAFNCRLELQHDVNQSLDLPELQLFGDTLDCSAEQALLYATSNPEDTSFQLRWLGPKGKEFRTDSILVSVPGWYTARLAKDTICVVEDSIFLEENFNAFPHQLTADTINCIDSVANINITGPDSFTYIWMGPGGFVELGQTVNATEGGSYTVQVETPACIYSRGIELIADTEVPQLRLDISNISCDKDSASITQVSSPNDSLWFFEADSMRYVFIENDTITTYSAGDYQIRLTASNGCVNDTTIEVFADTLAGQYAIEFMDTLSCLTDSVEVVLQSSKIEEVNWYQDGILVDSGEQAWISSFDSLYIEMVFDNACMADTLVSVPIDTASPQIQFESRDLSCAETSYLLEVDVSEGVDSILWTIPGHSFITTDTVLLIDTAGNYRAEVIGVNGCRYDTLFTIGLDTLTQDIGFENDTIACGEDRTTISVIIDTASLSDYYWELESDSLIEELNPNLAKGRHAFFYRGTNGCLDSMAVEITLDDYKVEIGNIPDSLRLVCDSLAYQIEPDLPMNAVSSEWILPDDMKITSQDLTIDSPGLYQFIVYDEDACGDTTPLHVVLDTIAPSIQLFEDTLDCNRPGISLQYVSDGSEVDISWTGPNGFQSNSSEPLISDGGIYYLELSDRGGCTARDSVFIEEDFQLPAYQLADTFYSNCDDGQAELWVETNVEDVSWYINNQLVSNADSFSTELDGRFRIILEGENGCRAIDSVWVNSNGKTPRAQWHTPVLSCTNLIDTFQLLQAEGQYDYKWTGPNNYSSTNASAVVGQEGMYRVTITDAKGCDTNYTFQLEQISYPIAIDFIVQNMIRCADSVASVNVDLDHGLKDTLVNWQAIQGEILQGASKLKAELKGPGLFVFEVKDTIDGCIASDTLQLREFPKPPLSIIANIQDKLCEEDRGTFIEILPQDSSRAPFQYSIEDMGFTEEYKYLNLLPGNYNIQVRDRQGCLYEEDYEILDLSGEQHLTLGEDRDVNLGEDVIIHPTIYVNEGIIDKAIWVVNGDTVCMQCDSLEVFIDDSKKVEFIIRTKGGCTVYDQLNLLAPIKQEIFVPNIFSPNNDGSNDIFFIQTRLELDQIELVQIFDRWGNRVFEAKNFPPNERIYGWDGTFEGKTLFPQVFAVRLIYVYEGERRIEHYDLMLMR